MASMLILAAFQGSDVAMSSWSAASCRNGVDFTGKTITLAEEDDTILAGTLSGGSPFLFNQSDGDTFAEVTLPAGPLPLLDLVPIFVDGSAPRTDSKEAGGNEQLQV